MTDDGLDLEAIDRFVRRDGTPEQLVELARWVHADPRRRAIADMMRTIGSPGRVWDAHRALRRLERKTSRCAEQTGGHGARIRQAFETRRRGRGRRALGRGAGIAAVLAIGVWSLLHDRPARTTRPALPPKEVVTAPGQRAVMTLRDGTRVVLSAESHLRVLGDFAAPTAEPREIWLEGEAYFAVTHDSTRPFVVHTPQGSAEDLGTEFVINTYPETRGMRLAVREGRVAIRPALASSGASVTGRSGLGAPAPTVLGAGDVALVSDDGRLAVTQARDLGLLFAASDGSLVLRSVALRDALPRLERWFGIRVRVADRDLLSRRISGEFRSETATEAFDVIAIALASKVQWHQNEVTLMSDHGRGENQQ
jgi:ferric-dicitrate binding protein FerR (iron transport regulator)